MFLIDLLDAAGLAMTLLALALLAAGGYLLALRLLGEEARRDLLSLAIASLLAMTAEALAIGLLLGAAGWLDFKLALLAQTLLVGALTLAGRRARAAAAGRSTLAGNPDPGEASHRLPGEREIPGPSPDGAPGGDAGPARFGHRVWARLREHPALALITAHAVGSEALRGLLRPPLSFDSLMYHLLLTATWLQERNLKVFSSTYPISDYAYVPANGSLWLWWWMAPSHSELYANLSALPQWLLLGLAAGGIARQLGARRHWPLASFLVLLTPTVARFVATQYVDIFLAATLLAACFFAMRWLERPTWSDAALAGVGCGLACGAKILGVPYCGALAAAALLLVPLAAGRWRARLPQLALAMLLALGLGSFFYLRNMALGAGPLALLCEGRNDAGSTQSPSAIASRGKAPATPREPGAASSATAAPAPAAAAAASPPARVLPVLPRPESVLDLWAQIGRAQVLDSFLGITRPQSVELGFGPQAFLLLLAFVALPFGIAAPQRRAALLATSQIGFELVFWLLVPYAANLAIFANLRYLIPAAGLAFAGGIAMAEQRGMNDLWLRGLAIALACQGLLQLHAEMPRGVRLALAALDVAAVVLGMSAPLRRLVLRRARPLAVAALLLALAGAPLLARFRVADRSRALTHEWTAHQTSTYVFTSAWRWLDEHGGSGAVAVIASPGTYFVYPAMGPYLERKVRYVNVNAANYDAPNRYPFCNPRVDPSFPAWLDHLLTTETRWLLVSRYPEFDWPAERDWAQAHPGLFELRFADTSNQIYELHPPPLIPWRTPRR